MTIKEHLKELLKDLFYWFLIGAGISIVGILLVSVAFGAGLPDVSLRVGRAQSFTYNFTAQQYQQDLVRRDVIWNNQPSSTQEPAPPANPIVFPPGTLSSAYTTIARTPPYDEAFGNVVVHGHDIAWFQANLPSCIVLTNDHATPAYEYGDIWVPLDYTNPVCQAWRRDNEILPMLSAGYQSISVDNVSAQNDFDRAGVCSKAVPVGQTPPATCESVGGTWTQLWSGQLVGDAKFVADQVAWLQYLAGVVHAHNALLMANTTYATTDLAGTTALVKAVDIWYDEAGFTGDAAPPACAPDGGGSGVVDQAWIDKFNFVSNLLNQGIAYVTENGICNFGDPKTQAVLDYALASYLLVKNAHTYFLWFFNGDTSAYQDATPGGIWPEYDWVHGAISDSPRVTGGVYWRPFANGLALLNPSTTASVGFNLPAGATYKDFAGNTFSRSVALAPTSGIILTLQAAPPPPPPPVCTASASGNGYKAHCNGPATFTLTPDN